MKQYYDVIIIGGGPAGLAAGLKLFHLGIRKIAIIEREKRLGGILRQCIHDGFGLTRFGQSMTGPEYAEFFIQEIKKTSVSIFLDTMVLDVTKEKQIIISSRKGIQILEGKAILFTTGCKERTRGQISIPGNRPSGVFTAGVAQSYINLHNKMIGQNIIILGSGDIGLIMARRLTLEGAKVHMVLEVKEEPSGLPRNVKQCLHDFSIPLYTSKTISCIHGKQRVQGVTIQDVDDKYNLIPGTEQNISCDTVILSVGLIPENDLAISVGIELDPVTKGPLVNEKYETSLPGFFSVGNSLHVHDLVDFVSLEAEKAASSIYHSIHHHSKPSKKWNIETDPKISYIVPQYLEGQKNILFSFRVKENYRNCTLSIQQKNQEILRKKFIKLSPSEMVQISLKEIPFPPKNKVRLIIE